MAVTNYPKSGGTQLTAEDSSILLTESGSELVIESSQAEVTFTNMIKHPLS